MEFDLFDFLQENVRSFLKKNQNYQNQTKVLNRAFQKASFTKNSAIKLFYKKIKNDFFYS
jgi:hypothetical protein